MTPLSDRDKSILDFESQNPHHDGIKEEKIVRTYNMSATRYYQILGALIDHPEAQEYKPVMMNRMRRVRDENRWKRSAKRIGLEL